MTISKDSLWEAAPTLSSLAMTPIKKTQSYIESDPMIQGAHLIGNEEGQIPKRETPNPGCLN